MTRVAVLIGSLLCLAGLTTPARADVWTKASVDLVGLRPDGALQPFVYLTHASASPLFTKRYFRVVGPNAREVLAVLLAAQTSDRLVQVQSDVDTVNTGTATIKVLYLTTESVPAQ